MLNGPPACGKSTLAQRYVDEHPLALNLDVDRVRSLIGRWRADPPAAGLLARRIALAGARAHLVSGHDVVVPQFLGRVTFIEQLEGLAGEVGAGFHEIVLFDSLENILRRFAERGRAAADPLHVEAKEMVESGGGFEDLSVMYDRLLSVLSVRPGARIVHVEDGDVELTYQTLLRNLE